MDMDMVWHVRLPAASFWCMDFLRARQSVHDHGHSPLCAPVSCWACIATRFAIV